MFRTVQDRTLHEVQDCSAGRDEPFRPTNVHGLSMLLSRHDAGTPDPRRDVKEVGGAELVRDTALHVHGLRFLSSAQVLELFKGQGVASIEWVSNDSCKLFHVCVQATCCGYRIGPIVSMPCLL